MKFSALIGFAVALGVGAAAPASIVETAQSVPELSSLVDALVAADLVDALSTDGPFTVFAPTNDAFAAISSVVEGLTMEQLQQVLEYHVVSGAAVKVGDLSNMQVILPLFAGHSLGVDLEETDKIARIVGETNAVTVTTADVVCSNGVVHIVDAVLIPKLSLAPFVQTFSCDHECIKTEARLQGVDVITSLDNIQYSMEVVFQDDNSVSGDACGKTNLQFPPYRVAANPSIGTKITTTETRLEPSIVFECEPGKIYHLLMSDAMGGGFQNTIAYNHWLKLNLVCEQNGQAKVENNGRDVVLGAPNIPGWYSGKGYLPPGFPFNSFHHFGFYIYETATPFTDAELDQIDVDFQIHNVLGGPIPAYLVEEVAAFLKFTAPPVALTWMDVTTSYYSQVRMAKLAAVNPQFAEQSFYKNICPCNLASSFPGLLPNGLHFAGASECNL